MDLYLTLFFSQCVIGIYFLSVLDRLNTNVDSFGQGLASNQFPMEVSAAVELHPVAPVPYDAGTQCTHCTPLHATPPFLQLRATPWR